MAYIKKEVRIKVWLKYNKHCAYCGKELVYEGMQIDHVEPQRTGGTDDFENLNPSCPRCNNWKHCYNVEGLRYMIENLVFGLRRDRSQFRMAEDFGLIQETNKKVIFYFEKPHSIKE